MTAEMLYLQRQTNRNSVKDSKLDKSDDEKMRETSIGDEFAIYYAIC